MKKIYVFLMLFFVGSLLPQVSAQRLAEYTCTSSLGTYTPVSSSATVMSPSSTDDGSAQLALPFNFAFGEETFSSGSTIYVGTNGYITLNANYTSTTPSTSGNYSVISPLGHDLRLNTNSEKMKYEVTGTAPNRVLTIEWCGIETYYSSNNPYNIYNFQVKLYEGSSNIQFCYGAFTMETSKTPFCFLREYTNNDYVWIKSDWNTPVFNTTGTINGLSISTSSYPAEGRIYTFTRPVVTCPKPINPTITGLGTTAATMTWTAGGTESNWDVYVALASAAEPTSTTAPTASTTSTSYTFTGLTPGATYKAYVRANCGGGDKSSWNSVSFMTFCNPVSLPYTENFDSYTTSGSGNLPSCWRLYQPYESGSTVYPYISSSNPVSGNMSFYFYSSSSVNPIVVLPEFDLGNLSSVKDLRVKFNMRPGNLNAKIVVGVMTNPLEPSTFVAVKTVQNSVANEYEYHRVSLSGYSGSGRFIALKHLNSGGTYTIYIDDIVVEEIPACIEIENPTVTNITTTSATVSWTAVGTESSWDVYIAPASANAPTASTTPTETVNSTSKTFTGLTQNTKYTVYVRANCGNNIVSEWEPVSFYTACDPISVLPYEEDFESYPTNTNSTPVANNLPNCWDYYCTSTSTTSSYRFYPILYSASATAHSGSNYLRFYSFTTTSTYGDEYAILPEINTALIPINTLRLTFWQREGSTTSTYHFPLIVGVMSDPNVPSSFVPIDTFLMESTTYTQQTVDFNSYTGNGNRIAFKMERSTSGYNTGYVDDIKLEEIPQCTAPTQLTVSEKTNNQATVSWTAGSTETAWTVLCYPADATASDGISVNVTGTPTCVISSLLANTTYQVFVMANCPGGGHSASISTTFTTMCDPEPLPFTEDFESFTSYGTAVYPDCWQRSQTYNLTSTTKYPYVSNSTYAPSGTRSLYFYSSSSTNNTAVLPQMNLGNYSMRNLKVSFSMRTPSSYSACKMMVGVMTNPDSASTFVPVDTVQNTVTGSSQQHSVFLLPYTGNGRFIAFRNLNTSTYPTYIDDVTVELITCFNPTALALTAVTSSTATVSWTAGDQENQWDVYIASSTAAAPTAATAPIATVNSATHTFTELAAGTSYKAYVRANCGNGDVSEWVSVDLTTNCNPMALPYTEDFDSYTSTGSASYVTCWRRYQTYVNGTYIYPNISSSYPVSGTKCLYFTSNSSTYSLAVLPELALGNLSMSDLRVTFSMRPNNLTTKMVVGVMDNPVDPSSFVPVDTVQNTAASVHEVHKVLLSNYTGNGGFIAFRLLNTSGTYGLYIDDVTVEEAPYCLEPNDITVTNLSDNSAEIAWTAGATESSWDVYIAESTAEAPTEITQPLASVNTPTYAFPSLNAGASYKAYVRANCVSDGVSPWVSVEFTTLCNPLTVPYTENFNSYSQGISTNTAVPTGYPAVDMPTCWLFKNRSNSTSAYPQAFLTSYSYYAVDGNCLFFKSSSTTPLYAVLPAMSENINNLQLTYTYRNESVSASNGTLYVGYMTNPMDESSFVSLHTCAQTTEKTPELVRYNTVNPTPNTSYYIAFKYVGGTSNNYYLSIDDVSVELIPSCLPPTTPVVSNVSDNGATITWTAGGTETSWELGIAEEGTSNWNTVIVNNNPTYDVTGLIASTGYQLRVKALCGTNDESTYATTTFATAACGLADQCLYTFVLGDSYGDGWNGGYLVVMQNDAPIDTLKAVNHSLSSTQTYDTVQMMLCHNTSIDLVWNSGNYDDEVSIYLFNPFGDQLFDQSDLTVFDDPLFTFTTNCIPPSCFDPTNLTMAEATATTATITWTLGGTESSWDLYLSSSITDVPTANSTPTYTVTATSYTFSDLTSGTAYTAYVRANCGSGDVSEWVSAPFATECEVVTVTPTTPFVENFDNATTSSLPPCWTNTRMVGTNDWQVVTPSSNPSSAYSGTQAVQFKSITRGNQSTLQMPTFDLTGLAHPMLSFWYTNKLWSNDQDTLKIYYRTSSTDTWSLLATYDSDISSWTQDSLLLPNPSATYQILFYGISRYGYGIYLDDVTVKEGNIPTSQCGYVFALNDSYGDGWNNAGIGVYADGDLVDILTISNGFSETDTLMFDDGTALELEWIMGGWDAEASFTLYDPFGYEVYSFAVDNAPDDEDVFYTGTVTCTPPACFAPRNLSLLGTTVNSATVTWTAGNTETAWEVYLSSTATDVPDATSNPTATATDTIYTFTNLTAGTTYTAYVRSNCGNDGLSNWVPVEFIPGLCDYVFVLNGGDIEGGWNGAGLVVIVNGTPIDTLDMWKVIDEGDDYPNAIPVTFADGATLSLLWIPGLQDEDISFTLTDPYGYSVYTCTDASTLGDTIYTGVISCSSPTCPPPTNLVVSDVANTSATLTWTPSGNESSWAVEIAEFGSSNWSTFTANNTPTYTLTGLTASTPYQVRVKAVCAADDDSYYVTNSFTTAACALADQCSYTFVLGDGYGDGWNGGSLVVTQNGSAVATIQAINHNVSSTQTYDTIHLMLCNNMSTSLVWHSGDFDDEVGVLLLGPDGLQLFSQEDLSAASATIFTFTTDCSAAPCSAVSIPYSENFDSYPFTGNAYYPECWKRSNTYSSTNEYPYIGNFVSLSGSNSLYFYSSSSTYNLAVLPQLSLGNLSMSDLQVRFSMYSSNVNAKMVVGVMTNPQDVSTFTPIDTVKIGTASTFEEHKVSLSSYTGNGRYVALRNINTSYNSISIDDVWVEQLPSCRNVTQLGVTVLTDSSATVAWTAGSTETAWDLYLSTSAADVPNANSTPTASATSPAYTFAGLTGNTTYTAYVRADCGAEKSEWENVSFTTPCRAVTLPYSENFDSYTTTGVGNIPDCWTQNSSYSPGYPYINGNNAFSGSNSIYYYCSNTAYNMAVLPEVNLGDLLMSDLRVKFTMNPSSTNAKIIVGVMTNPTDVSTFVPVDTVQNSEAALFEEHKVLLTNYNGNGKYVALKNYNVDGYYSIYLDDVVLEQIPACPEPNDLTVTDITATTATLSWTTAGTPAGFTVEYSADNGASWITASNTVTASPYTITNLTPRSYYDVRVFANCGTETSNASYTSVNTQCVLQGELPIGTVENNTSSYIPSSTVWKYSLAEQLFTAAELGNQPSNLSAVSFYCTSNYVTDRNWDIYLISVPSSTTTLSSFVDLNNGSMMDTVFSGTVRINNGWITVNFDKDYPYDGTSNLILVLDDNTGSFNNTFYFATNAYTNGAVYVRSDNTNYNPDSMSVLSPYTYNYRNVVKFTYCNDMGVICPVPTDLAATNVTSSTADITWTDPNTAYQALQLQYQPANGTTSQNVDTTLDFSQKGYSNGQSLDGENVTIDNNISFVANKGTSNTAPAYYDIGSALRIYGKNNFVVTAANGVVITGIEIEAGASNHPNINWSADGGQSHSINGTSTHYIIDSLAANTVTVTNPATSGHLRMESLTVHYTVSGDGWMNVENPVSPQTLTNLTPETEYLVRMRAICSAGDTSVWSDINFTTAEVCMPPTNLAVVPTSNSAEITWTPAGTGTQWDVQYKFLVPTPENKTLEYVIGDHTADITGNIMTGFDMDDNIRLTGTKDGGTNNPALANNNTELRLYFANNNTHNGCYITLTPSNNAVITGLDIVASGNTPAVAYTVDGGTAATMSQSGTTYTLSGIQAQNSLKIQNVNTNNTQLRITKLTVYYTLAADTSWHEVAGGVTTPAATLTNLVSNTEYSVRVRTDCGNDGVSSWTSTDFTTLCGVLVPPYAENFDNTNGSLPDCWTSTVDTGTTNWVVTSSFHGSINSAHSGNSVAQFYQNGSGHKASLQMPTFDLTGLNKPMLKYWYTNQKWSYDQDVMEIYYRTSPADTWTLLATYDNNVSSWTKDSLLLPNPSATYQIKFKGISNYGYGINLDDVSIEEGPTCILPTNLAVSNVTSSEATITWTAGDAETAWDVYISSEASATPNITVNTTSYTFTNLTPVTPYTAYVRSNCGNGDVSDWISVTFAPGTYNMKTTGWDTLHTCEMVIYDDGGFNRNYSNNCNAYLVIYPDEPNNYVQVSGTINAEQARYDSLIIYDGAGITTPLYVSSHSSGVSTNIPTITSTTGPLTIHFVSDNGVSYEGFALTVGCKCIVTNEVAVTACGSYTWNGTNYTATGDYQYTYSLANGCDSVVTLHLTINPIPVVTISGDAAIALFESATLTASGADTYVWNTNETTSSITVTPSAIGNYTYTVTGTSNNCESTPATFTVEVGACRPGTSTETVTACNSFEWHGTTYTQSTNSANYRIPEGSYTGCDSVITLHLTILNSVYTEFTASNCVSYQWNDSIYTASGDYVQTFPAANGCDSIVTLHLTIKQPVTNIVNEVACGSYVWNNQTLTTTGDYEQTFTAANGCDSVVTLHLTIKPIATNLVEATSCGSYNWNGQVYTASGDYEQTFTAANGCDSVVTLRLTILPVYDQVVDLPICKAALPYTWRDTLFAAGTETGTYVFHRQTAAGCDSTVTLHLVVNEAIATEFTDTGCESYTWNNQVYTTSGNYVQTLQSTAGCDSTVTLHLTIYNPTHQAFTEVACGSYTWNNTEYTQSGDYTYAHLDANGCTQVDTLHLTIKPVPVVTITTDPVMPFIAYGESATLTASGADSYLWNLQQTTPSIVVSPRFTATYYVLGTTDGCVSDTVFVTVNVGDCQLILNEFSATGCGSYNWNGTVYTASGDYQQHLYNDTGCDSVVTLHLTIYPNQGVAQTVNACGSYTWYQQRFTQSGTYTFAYYDGHGCIQEDTLILTIHNPVHEAFNIVSCGPYMWNNTEYTQDGTYTYTHEDAHGCTQVDTLHLTIKPVPVVTVSANTTQLVQHEIATLTATGATSYVWSNQMTGATVAVTPMQTTTYSVVGMMNGCSSEPASITIEVTPCTPAYGVETVTACNSYTWYGTVYTASTNEPTHAIQRQGICDSIVTLHLTILHPVPQIVDVTACESYNWNNMVYRQSGTYTYSHLDANGCTQVDTLHLTIIHPTHTAVTVSECNAFVWHNTEYTQSGTYTFAHADHNGCTQVDTLHLTIFHPAHTAYNVDACESYTWNGTVYTQSGVYTYRHRDANNCTQVDTLHLTIHHPVAETFEATACESYTWHNTVYTQSGVYTYVHDDTYNCQQVDTLRLTVYHAVAEVVEATACESYTWNNTVYTQSGTYTYSHLDANGCTQVDTLHLTVHHAVAEVANITACESYLWNGTEYTQSGTYTFTHADAHGCTQVDTLHLIINNPTHVAFTESACSSYTWNNTEYTQSGVYTFAHADANGCTQVDTLHLTIFQPAATEFSANACGSYYWNYVYYDQSGDYVQHFQTVDGCDSTVTLHLTIHPRAEVAGIVGDTIIHEFESTTLTATSSAGNIFWVGYGYTPSITVSPMQTTTYSVMSISEYCASTPVRVTVHVLPCIPVQGVETVTACESYEWHGVTYTESTDQPTFTIERQGVCDSIVTLHLTILRPTNVAYTEGACGSYVWNNTEYTQSGTYTFAHVDDNGCTQVDTLHLTIYNPTHEAFAVSECNSYTWNNTVYMQSGTYTYAHADAHGCTQVDTLHLTIYNPVHEAFEASACGSYVWNNTEYTQGGTYTFAHTDVHGCTQVDTLHLTIYNPTHVAYTESACGSYVWNNTEYTQSGTYTFAHADANGCTQVDTLHLTILNAIHEAFTVSECNSYIWHNTEYTESGDYTYIHSDINGCTKVDTLHLTIFHPQPNVYTLTTCGDYVWHGTVYTQTGVYTYTTTDINGCTQVDTLHLFVNRPQNTASTIEACGSYVWRGNTYTQSGVYVKAVQDNFGCMYLDTLYLTIHQPATSLFEVTACESYTWNNVLYTQSGNYVQHFQTVHGCDSAVTMHLTVLHPVHQSVTVGECGSYTWNGTTYTASGTYTYAHADANGCTQVDTLHLIIYQPIHQALFITDCESFTWGGTTYTQSGVYTYAHPDNHGCTQVDTLYLTINHPVGTSITVTECEMYDWNGFIYTQSGTYTQSHLDNNGCTQVDTLHLTIYHPVHQSVTVSDCYEYTWHGTTYNFSGVYTYAHLDNHGCTQVDTLHLTIYHPQSSTVTVDACGSYQWYGVNYTQSGVYTHNATSTYGCQVVDTLILHIHHSATTEFTAHACSYYVWEGTTYTQSGDYVKHFFTPWGCDSVVTLHLNIHQPQSSEFSVTTENSCYTWNGIDYCQSGTYMQSFEDQYGCDSVVTLHLTLQVGISEFEDYAVSLYPNPTTGVTYVEVSGDEMESVEVYDAYGKLLQTMKVSGNVTQLELSGYATGTYYVRVTTTKSVVTKRVVKN